MNETKYAQLKTELTTDPKALGYAGMNDEAAADALNLLRDEEPKDRTIIPTWRLLTALDDAEFAALTAIRVSMFQSVCACGQVDLSDGRIRAILQRIFTASALTKANLIALANEPGARWETLNLGGPVAEWDVSRVRSL